LFSTGLLFFWFGISAYFLFLFSCFLLSRISFNKKDLHLGLDVLLSMDFSDIIVIPITECNMSHYMKDLFQVFWIGKIEVLLQEEAQAISKSELKEQAENIKQLLMGKFKTTVNEE
jgi:hypothetical protein